MVYSEKKNSIRNISYIRKKNPLKIYIIIIILIIIINKLLVEIAKV